jgi:hypothetical protein
MAEAAWPRNATNATTGAGHAMRSSGRAITCRSTSSSSNPCRPVPPLTLLPERRPDARRPYRAPAVSGPELNLI